MADAIARVGHGRFSGQKPSFCGKSWFSTPKQPVSQQKTVPNQLFPSENKKNSLVGLWQHFLFLVFQGKNRFPVETNLLLAKMFCFFGTNQPFPREKLVFHSMTTLFLANSVYFICCLCALRIRFQCDYYWDSISSSINTTQGKRRNNRFGVNRELVLQV